MKKIISLFPLFILALALAACSSTIQASTGSNSVRPTQPVQITQVEQPTDPKTETPLAASKDQTRTDTQGAKKLTLTVKNVDAPQRIFTWELP